MIIDACLYELGEWEVYWWLCRCQIVSIWWSVCWHILVVWTYDGKGTAE